MVFLHLYWFEPLIHVDLVVRPTEMSRAQISDASAISIPLFRFFIMVKL